MPPQELNKQMAHYRLIDNGSPKARKKTVRPKKCAAAEINSQAASMVPG
jgi:hypothetical protein